MRPDYRLQPGSDRERWSRIQNVMTRARRLSPGRWADSGDVRQLERQAKGTRSDVSREGKMGPTGALFMLPVALLVGSPALVEGSGPDEAAIRTLDTEMVAALNGRDVDRYLGFLSEDAIWMPPNRPAVVGKAAIRELVSKLIEIPDYTVAHHPRSIEVSRGGDLAYLSYEYEFTVKSADGATVTERGKDVSVFRREGGSWELVIDIWASDGPLPGVEP